MNPFTKGLIAVIAWASCAVVVCSLSHVPVLLVASLAQISGALGIFLTRSQLPSLKCLLDTIRTDTSFILCLVCNQIAYVNAFRLAPPAQVDLINYLWPTGLCLSLCLFHRRAPSSMQLLGIALGLAGVVTVVYPELCPEHLTWAILVGYFGATLAALSWVVYNLIPLHRGEAPEDHDIAKHVLIAGLVIGCGHFLWEPPYTINVFDFAYILAYGMLVYGLSYPLWNAAIQSQDFIRVSSLANLIPILSVIGLILGGYTELTMHLVVATVLVTVGCVLVTPGPQPRKSDTGQNRY